MECVTVAFSMHSEESYKGKKGRQHCKCYSSDLTVSEVIRLLKRAVRKSEQTRLLL